MSKNILIKGLSKSIKNIKKNMYNNSNIKNEDKYKNLKCLKDYTGE